MKGAGSWSSLVTFQFPPFVDLILFLLVILNEKQIEIRGQGEKGLQAPQNNQPSCHL